MKRAITVFGTVVVTVFVAGQAAIQAQTPPAQPAAAAAPAPANKTPPFKQEELEAMLAPIALYPDALLAQIFMASTYPLEVVEAARWSKEHPDVKGDAVAGAVQSQTWDPSVKSLVAFPSVLAKMNEKIDWTQKLGDAFLAQQKEVMQAVQILRNKAKETGNLKSTKEVTVKEEPAPAGSPAPQTIIIESPDPEVVYVPTYNPTRGVRRLGISHVPALPYYPPGYAYAGARSGGSRPASSSVARSGATATGAATTSTSTSTARTISTRTRSTPTAITAAIALATTAPPIVPATTAPAPSRAGTTTPRIARESATRIRPRSRSTTAAAISRMSRRASSTAAMPSRAASR